MVIRLDTMTMRNWSHASPTQIKTADSCLRKWWFEKIPRSEPIPPTEAMKRGTRVHALLEHWLNASKEAGHWLMEATEWAQVLFSCNVKGITGFETNLAKNARGWVSQTVDLKSAKAEGSFLIPLEAAPLRGVIDIDDDLGITDYKTTSDYKWIPAEEVLRRDAQCVGYMAKWFRDHPDKDTGRYQHIYMNTTSGGARAPLTFEVTREENQQRLETLNDKVAVLAHYSKVKVSSEVPADPGAACSKYGGCPFAKQCSSYRVNNLGDHMGLFDQVQKDVEKDGTERAKSVQNSYADDVSADLDSTLREAGFTQDQIDGMTIAERARLALKHKQGMLSEADLKACRVNPPDGMSDEEKAPAPKAAWSGACLPDTQISIKKAKAKDIREYFAEKWDVAPLAVGGYLKELKQTHKLTSDQLREEICKWATGLKSAFSEPKKEKKKKAVFEDVTAESAPEPKEHTDAMMRAKAREIRQTAQEVIKAKVHSQGPQILAVGCHPMKGMSFTSFFQWIQPIVDRVQEEMDQQAEKSGSMKQLWSADKYGEGKKLVGSFLRECITGDGGQRLGIDLAPMPACLSADPGHPAADICLSLLVDFYPIVIWKS